MGGWGRTARGVEVAGGVAFVGFAALQWNDPDPLRWMALYGAAAVLCAWPARPAPAVIGLGALALGWGSLLLPGVLAEAELADLVRTMKHENRAEEARELAGLLIVAGAAAGLALRAARPAVAVASLGGAGALAVAAGLAAAAPARAPSPGPRPVLLVVVDTLRADHLGTYGFDGPISPALDRFAAGSLVYDRCYSQAPWTLASMATAFTSLAPSTHGVVTKDERAKPLPEQAETLAEALSAAGWRTGAFVANDWLQPSLGYARGFDTYALLQPEPGRKTPSAGPALERARAWIGDGGDRWFAYVHLMDVHFPYRDLDAEAAALVGSGTLGDRVSLTDLERAALPDWIVRRLPSPHDLRELRLWYAGGVRGTDAVLGAFLDDLARRGVLDDAIVVVTADHGEELVDHGAWGHGQSVHEELLHVPLLVRVPGGRGGRIPGVVSLVDLAPSLLGALGQPSLPLAQGRDLGFLDPGGALGEPSFGEGPEPGDASVRTAEWTLVRDAEGVRLYAAGDPAERTDLARAEPAVVDALQELLAEHASRVAGSLQPVGEGVLLDEALQRELRDLGYAVGPE